MALASQSGRSTSRRSYMSSRRRSRRSRWIFGILILAIASIAGWWFTSGPQNVAEPDPVATSTSEALAPTEEITSASARESEIVFDDGRGASNQGISTATPEQAQTDRSDLAKRTVSVTSPQESTASSKPTQPAPTSRHSDWW